MEKNASVNHWRSHSAVTRIDSSAKALDAVPADLSGLRQVSQQLVTHYMGFSDELSDPVTGPRLAEVDTRYADPMFARILELGEPTLLRARPVAERIAGCCRDFALLYVAMARHKGIPARMRVGYANYFLAGWYVDHVIAEAWDAAEGRWRLIEPEIGDDFTPATDERFDPLDVPPDRFLVGPRAWLLARSSEIDPERFLVDPDLAIPYTRGWLSLRHHVVHDLAALNKTEMLLWDQWGILNDEDPLAQAEMLDELSRAMLDPDCSPATLADWMARDGLSIPPTVVSYSPTQFDPLEVDVSPTLASVLLG